MPNSAWKIVTLELQVDVELDLIFIVSRSAVVIYIGHLTISLHWNKFLEHLLLAWICLVIEDEIYSTTWPHYDEVSNTNIAINRRTPTASWLLDCHQVSVDIRSRSIREPHLVETVEGKKRRERERTMVSFRKITKREQTWIPSLIPGDLKSVVDLVLDPDDLPEMRMVESGRVPWLNFGTGGNTTKVGFFLERHPCNSALEQIQYFAWAKILHMRMRGKTGRSRYVKRFSKVDIVYRQWS
jgi:hypothetical protein